MCYNRKAEVEQELLVVGHIVARVGYSRVVVGPCIACSLRSGVALAPDPILCALVDCNEASAPKNKRCTSIESSWIKHMEEARYLEVAEKGAQWRGTGATPHAPPSQACNAYTTCSTSATLQFHNKLSCPLFSVTTEQLK